MSQVHIMALRHSAFYSPLLMTMAGGFLADEGLEFSYHIATPKRSVTHCMADGSCHVAQSAVATSFAALEAGETVDLVHFAQINERDGFFIAAREPDPDFNWSALRGRTVLVDHFFQPLAMLRYGLHRQGVDLDELDVIDAGDPEAMDRAFRAGRGDFIHQQGPAPQQLEKDGIASVVGAIGDAIGPVAFSSLCAHREWLETDEAQAFMRAYVRGRAHVIITPAVELAARMIEAGFFHGIDIEVLIHTIDTYKSLGCWTPHVEITREAYDNLLEVFLHSGAITRRHPYEAAIVAPPLHSAAEKEPYFEHLLDTLRRQQ